MRSRLLTVAIAIVSLTAPAFAGAACPPEVKQAKDLLTAKTVSAKAKSTGPSKTLAAARGQNEQTARGQNEQTARGQNEQAPRAKDRPEHPEGPVPRGQDEQAPRNVAKGRANALANARRLVGEAEVACKDADGQRASANAQAAMELLKYVP